MRLIIKHGNFLRSRNVFNEKSPNKLYAISIIIKKKKKNPIRHDPHKSVTSAGARAFVFSKRRDTDAAGVRFSFTGRRTSVRVPGRATIAAKSDRRGVVVC